MVRIALAGGSGGVGREILDVLVTTGKHDIVVISRQVEFHPNSFHNEHTIDLILSS